MAVFRASGKDLSKRKKIPVRFFDRHSTGKTI